MTSVNFSLLDIRVEEADLFSAARMIINDALTPAPKSYRLLNAYSIACADADASYRHLLLGAGINFVDGRPLVAALNSLGRKRCTKHSQVRGPALFAECLDQGRRSGIRHFLLGSSPETLDLLVSNLHRRFPGIRIVGSLSPPFRPLTDSERRSQDDNITACSPDLVWVGLGSPKQDFEARRICAELGVTAVGIGAAFDFLAGCKPDAPALLRKLGLEWAFRLASEPRRLWKRYLFGNARFLAVVWRTARGGC